MSSIFHVNTDQINNDFMEKIKSLFPHQEVEIVVQEKDKTPRKNWKNSFGSPELIEVENIFPFLVNETDDTEWTW